MHVALESLLGEMHVRLVVLYLLSVGMIPVHVIFVGSGSEI